MNVFDRAALSPSSRAWARRWLVALGLGLATLVASAMDDPPGRVGRVGESRGQVWMIEGGQGEWFNLQRNRPFTTGDRIATDRDARVELQVGSTTLRVGESSDLQVMRLDDDRIELQLQSGSVSVRVREPEVARELSLQTAEGRFAPRGPGLFRIDHGDRGSMGAALSGELQFDARDSSLAIRPGQRAEVWLDSNDNATHFNWASLGNDELDQWVRRDEQRDARVATNRWVSPEMTGADDLESHGHWDEHPEYGALWTPVVAADWAPYRYGHWAFVSPWGWTWVDDASWGFAPFHYGRWVSWHGRWAWAPGRYVRRPVYAPAMVAWVGGPQFSVSVNVGGPSVGWIPLAPREAYYPAYRTSPVYIQNINVTHVHVQEPRDRDPRERPPVMYTNRGVPGGITVVPAQALAQRQPVAVATMRAPDAAVTRAFRDQRALSVAPPAPQGAAIAPRVVPTPASVLAAPRPPAARPGRSDIVTQPAPMPAPAPAPAAQQPVPQRPAPTRPAEVSAPPSRAVVPQPVAPIQEVQRPAVVPRSPVERMPVERAPVERAPVEQRAPVERSPAAERPQWHDRGQPAVVQRPPAQVERPQPMERPQPAERPQQAERPVPQRPQIEAAPVERRRDLQNDNGRDNNRDNGRDNRRDRRNEM